MVAGASFSAPRHSYRQSVAPLNSFQLNERAPWLPSSRNQNRLIVAGARLPLPQNMGKRPRGAASSASGPATAKCFLGGLSQLTDSDKLVKYFETKYAPYKVEMCEAVWK